VKIHQLVFPIAVVELEKQRAEDVRVEELGLRVLRDIVGREASSF
jgi:hypothetical protein